MLVVSSVTCQIWKKWSPVLMLVLERNVSGKFCYMSNMENWSPVLMLVLEKNVSGKFCYMSNMEKLVTSTHAGVREEC